MRTKLPVKLLAFALFFGGARPAAAQEKSSATLNDGLQQYRISFGDAGNVPVTRNYRFKAKGMLFHFLSGEDKGRRIELELIQDISTATAARYIDSRYAVLRDLYEPKSIPYGSAVTHDTECPEDMKPAEFSALVLGLPVKVLVANASARYALGVWEKSAVYKKAGFLVAHDKANRLLFQLLIFTDLKDFDDNTIPGLLAGIKRAPPAE